MLQGTVEHSLYLFQAGQLSPWGLRLLLCCVRFHIVFEG